MATTSQSIQEIYIGLLGRAADKAGLDYWTAEIDANTLTLEQLRANIVNDQAEYAADLGSKTRSQTVAELYNRMFERAAEAADLTYWVDGDGASVNIDQLVLALTNGAAASDRLVLDNKTEAAEFYSANTTAYTADGAKASVDSVDGTSASLEASKAATTGDTQSAGTTFTLTTTVDNLTGGNSNDTFNAVNEANVAAGDTLGVADVLDGGAGTDTLNITNTQSGALAGLTTSNIENLVIRSTDQDDTAETLNMNSLSGVTAVTLNSFTDGASVTNATLGTTFALSNFAADHADDDVTIAYKSATGSSDSASISTTGSVLQQVVVDSIETLTLSNSGSTVTSIASLDANAATTINIANETGTVSSAAGLTVTAMGDNVATKAVLTGAGTTTFTGAMSTALTTIDGSAATGALDLNVSSNANNLTVTLGSGDDRLEVGTVGTNLTTNDTINMGSGTNTVAIANTTLTTQDIKDITAVTGISVLEFAATAGVTVDSKDVSSVNAFKFSGVSAVTDAADDNATAAAGTAAVTVTGNETGDTFTVSANQTGGKGSDTTAAGAANGGAGAAAVVVTNEVDGGGDVFDITLAGGVTLTGGAGGDLANDATQNTASGNGGVGIDATTIETLNITSTGSAANSIVGGAAGATPDAGDTDGTAGASVVVNTNGTINVAGDKDLALGTISGTNATVDASAFTGKLSVTGEAGNNIIKGGEAVDTINGGAGIDTLTGNGGNDIFVFTDNESTTAATDSITDYTSTDIIRLVSTDEVAGASATAGTTATSDVQVAAGGKVTFAAADDTLAEMLVALAADTTDIAANEVVFFEQGSDTYIFQNVGGTDDLIKLTGVTGMSTLTESTAIAGDFTLA